MGEKIKTLRKIHFRGQDIDIELNKPLSLGKEKQIHIQTETLRIEFNETTFLKLSSAILVARKNLINIKKLDD